MKDLYTHDIIQRDIKTANILLRAEIETHALYINACISSGSNMFHKSSFSYPYTWCCCLPGNLQMSLLLVQGQYEMFTEVMFDIHDIGDDGLIMVCELLVFGNDSALWTCLLCSMWDGGVEFTDCTSTPRLLVQNLKFRESFGYMSINDSLLLFCCFAWSGCHLIC